LVGRFICPPGAGCELYNNIDSEIEKGREGISIYIPTERYIVCTC